MQIGITLVGILAGAFAGRERGGSGSPRISQGLPGLDAYHHEIALGLVVLIITYFSLVIGELVPKRLPCAIPKHRHRVALPLAALPGCQRRWCIYSARRRIRLPAVWPSAPAQQAPVTQEEITTLVQQGAEAGIFEETAEDMVEAVFRSRG